MQFPIEKRYAPRVYVSIPVKVFPDVEANLVNISETGICLECEGSVLQEDMTLLMDLFSSRIKRATKLSARMAWKKVLIGKKIQYGGRISLLDNDHFFQIRDYIFNSFARKASAGVKDKDAIAKVEDFFKKDVRQFHEKASLLVQTIENEKTDIDHIGEVLTLSINDILIKGEALEKRVNDKIQMRRIKQIFREVTGCWFYKSPILKMAYDKPRGYPGDYFLFDIIYNNRPLEQRKNFAYYGDKYFLNNDYAKAARARKNRMKNILQDYMENSNSKTIKLLNIACGPSRDIRELFADPLLLKEISDKKVVFTGLDNDKDALKFSKSALSHLPANIETRFIHENVLNLFKNVKYSAIIGKQDIIYILGLTEYLPDRIFKRLLSFLFLLLNKNGMLVITYKDKEITFPSLPPDWLCDWDFIKRSKDDLIKAAKELGVDKYSLNIDREGTGTIFFLKLTRVSD